jgi:ATP-dependent exoDNAse (exonuclease V) alpha subunit
MAVYFLNLKTFGRASGSSAVSAAAYRSGERLRDERTGRTYDHSNRQDVLHKEIILPHGLVAAELSWARDRSVLWNAAESAETRKNSRTAREYLVALPAELDDDRRRILAQEFARELVDRYKFAVDLAIHAPRDFPDSDPRNFHAHLLATTREAGEAGLGRKTTLEWNNEKRLAEGLGTDVGELMHVRKRWAEVTNLSLERSNVQERIDHRSLAAQGIDREPYPRLPRVVFEMERRGFQTFQGDAIRRQYEERVAARELRERARQAEPAQPVSLEEVRRQAVDAWRRLRQGAEVSAEPTPGRGRDDDLAQ